MDEFTLIVDVASDTPLVRSHFREHCCVGCSLSLRLWSGTVDSSHLLEESPETRQHFARELYKAEFQEEPEEEFSFNEGLPQVSEVDNAELEAGLSSQEQ